MKKLQRIVCVDDEPDMRMLVKLCLENVGGYDVTVCSSGRELLDNVVHWKPDLVLLDAVMPVMDGLTAMKELHKSEAGRNIPVLFMTGKAKDAEAELKAAGAIGLLIKPFDPIHLAQDVLHLWDLTQNG